MLLPSRSKPDDIHVDGGRSPRGVLLLETMVGVAGVGTGWLGVVSAFRAACRISSFVEDTATAEWLATSQIEVIRTAAFVLTPGTYPAVSAPAGFAVANTTSAITGGDENIQTVTVTVTKAGEVVYTTSTVKVNR